MYKKRLIDLTDKRLIKRRADEMLSNIQKKIKFDEAIKIIQKIDTNQSTIPLDSSHYFSHINLPTNVTDDNQSTTPLDSSHQFSHFDLPTNATDDKNEELPTYIIKESVTKRNIFRGFPFDDQIRMWSYTFFISEQALDSLLKILIDQGHNINKSGKGLRKPLKKMTLIANGTGKMYSKDLRSLLTSELEHYEIEKLPKKIDLELASDGMPPNNSKFQIWPIMIKVRNVKHSRPLFHTYFGGIEKPDTNLLLTPLANQYDELKRNPLTIKGRTFQVEFVKFKGDLLAVCAFLGIKNPGGYCACRRCLINGEYIKELRKVIYRFRDLKKRTDEAFRKAEKELRTRETPISEEEKKQMHNIAETKLVEIIIDLIKHVQTDPMHNILFGQVKTCVIRWTEGAGPAKLKPKLIQIISAAITELNFPSEFPRKCQRLEDIKRWKATELKNFLLYGFYAVRHQFPKNIQDHFLKLSCAIKLMCCPKTYKSYLHVVRSLLSSYFDECKNVYGLTHYTLNTHLLTHVHEEALELNAPIFEDSCFIYENALWGRKKLLKFGQNPLEQLIRRDEELARLNIPLEEKSYLPIISKISKEYPNIYTRIKINDFKLDLLKDSDSYYMSHDDVIKKFCGVMIKNNKIIILNKKLSSQEPEFLVPFNSTRLKIYGSAQKFSKHILEDTVENIYCKLFRLPSSTQENYSIFLPLHHSQHE